MAGQRAEAKAAVVEQLDALKLVETMDRDDAVGKGRLARAVADDEIGAACDGTGTGRDRGESLVDGARRREGENGHRAGPNLSRSVRPPVTALPPRPAPASSGAG